MSNEQSEESKELEVIVDDLYRVTSDVFSVQLKCLLSACPSCGNPVPLNGPVSRIQCPSCSLTVEIPQELWKSIIGLDWQIAVTKPFFPQQVSETQEYKTEGKGALRVQVERTFLHDVCCIRCLKPLGGVRGAVPQEAFTVGCPSCGLSNDFFLRSAAFPDMAIEVTHVAATEQDTSSTSAPSPKQREGSGQLVVMSCPNCSGGLKISTESERTTQCEFCGASVYIPDDLWRQLHPVKTTKAWEVMYRITPRALREAAKQKKVDAGTKAIFSMVGGGIFALFWIVAGLWCTFAPPHPSYVESGYIDLALGGGILLMTIVSAYSMVRRPKTLIRALEELAERFDRSA